MQNREAWDGDGMIRERLKDFWARSHWLRWLWLEERGPIIASVIFLAVMTAVLLLTYALA